MPGQNEGVCVSLQAVPGGSRAMYSSNMKSSSGPTSGLNPKLPPPPPPPPVVCCHGTSGNTEGSQAGWACLIWSKASRDRAWLG